MEKGFHALQVHVCWIHQDETRVVLQQNQLKRARLGLSHKRERVRDNRRTHPALIRRSHSLTYLTPIIEVRMLKGHGMGEGESELGGRFRFFLGTKTAVGAGCS